MLGSNSTFRPLDDLSFGGVAVSLITIYAVYFISLVLYRLYLSPLAAFPGSKLAAATGWYEFYYDLWLGGKYIFEIERMHKEYGPIIRVNPMELSIHDPDFYGEVYVTENKRQTNNYHAFCQGIDFEDSHFLSTEHALHRKRRKPLEPFFSRMGVTRLQPTLAEVASHFESRLRALRGTGTIVRLDHAFAAFSGDVIGSICLGNDRGDRFLDEPDFSPDWYNVIDAIVHSIPMMTGFPWIIRLVSYLPYNLLLAIFPQGQSFNTFKEKSQEHIHRVMNQIRNKDASEFSLFTHVANSDMPESERSVARLSREAQTLLGAGTASTARSLGFASYYILSRPEIRSGLQREVADIMAGWPDKIPSWAELERLTYLQAIIKETLRLSYGVMHRLPRVSPDVPIQYKDYFIPPGIPVGMSAYLMHSDPKVYPSPDQFIPERWIGDTDPRMPKSFVPFCRGSRNCLGQNLAMAEMSLMLAVLYRPIGPSIKLFETTERDVKHVHDFIIPLPDIRSKGVRIQVD